MSLDVYLMGDSIVQQPVRIFIREDGRTIAISRMEWDHRFPGREPVMTGPQETNKIYSDNITHNLGRMAAEAGIYEYLWRPDEIGVSKARQLIEPLRTGLAWVQSDRQKFEQFNPPNGWGNYDIFVEFLTNYLTACEANPDADVRVWR